MDSLLITNDAVWPWSLPLFGTPALAIVALLLAGLTVWTYLGVPAATPGRIATVLGLRLAALFVILLLLLRPSVGYRDDLKVPSVLLVAADSSESMTIQDEFDGQSRWALLQRSLRQAQPTLDRLRDERNVNVILYRFDADAADYEADGKAEGKRTDVGQALHTLLERHRGEKHLRGLILLSDGADNGIRHNPLQLAQQWRSLPCPLHAIGLGKTTTGERQSDIALTAINPEPSPVAVNTNLTVRGTIDAPGFLNARVRIRLFFDDREVLAQDETLTRIEGNEVKLETRAPGTPGEVKVTLKVQVLPGEVTVANNEISTYLTVTKEGVSVLLVDKERFPEPQMMLDALRGDPRIRLSTVRLRGNQPLDARQLDLFRFQKEHYDVILLGDVTADRLRAADARALATLHELVVVKGAGLLMMGGYDSFGPTWKGTEIEAVLPVQVGVSEQSERPAKMLPTVDGLKHFLLRQADKPEDSDAVWKKLYELNGMTRLGAAKPGAVVLARADDAKDGPALLVGQTVGAGRTLAFGGDTTYRWIRDEAGKESHARFWKQVVLWLAKQEEAEGHVWVKPDIRRLSSGGKLGLTTGIRGKSGIDFPAGEFDVKVVAPSGAESKVPTARDRDENRGTFWKTDAPGEYRVVVRGKAKDVDGTDVSGEASARFLVYQDEAEMLRRAADHEFLRRLSATGGGRYHRPEDLNRLLEELTEQPLAVDRTKSASWPDWRSNRMPEVLPAVLALFAMFLSLEWFLRRRWGMV